MEIKEMKLIYAAYSRNSSYFRTFMFKYILEQNCVPIGPIMEGLIGLIEDGGIENANMNLVRRCDGVWIFGPRSKEVLEIIILAEKLNKPLRYFSIVKDKEIIEVENAMD